jgi:hypothetical protein
VTIRQECRYGGGGTGAGSLGAASQTCSQTRPLLASQTALMLLRTAVLLMVVTSVLASQPRFMSTDGSTQRQLLNDAAPGFTATAGGRGAPGATAQPRSTVDLPGALEFLQTSLEVRLADAQVMLIM